MMDCYVVPPRNDRWLEDLWPLISKDLWNYFTQIGKVSLTPIPPLRIDNALLSDSLWPMYHYLTLRRMKSLTLVFILLSSLSLYPRTWTNAKGISFDGDYIEQDSLYVKIKHSYTLTTHTIQKDTL